MRYRLFRIYYFLRYGAVCQRLCISIYAYYSVRYYFTLSDLYLYGIADDVAPDLGPDGLCEPWSRRGRYASAQQPGPLGRPRIVVGGQAPLSPPRGSG